MTTPVVWSERPEPNAQSLKDCTYSSGLMGMVYADFAPFPLGAYTVAEREALERSDDQPDETGASLSDLCTAIKRRYGKTVTQNAPAALPGLLATKGIALAVQGVMGNLAADNRLRRWDPSFTGGHCVCVVPLGDGKALWLDPLAPNKYAGDTILVSTILDHYAQGSGASVTFKAGAFAPVKVYSQADMDKVQAALAAALARIAAAKAALG